jgi:hypothetical protein
MSNFWIFNKKNLFTPAIILYTFLSSLFIFQQELRSTSSNYQFLFLIIFLIISIGSFFSLFYFIDKSYENKNFLYLFLNLTFFSGIIFFIINGSRTLALNYNPTELIINYFYINLILILQFAVNQELKILKRVLFITYALTAILIFYIISPDFISVANENSIRIYQATAVIFIGFEIFRIISYKEFFNKIANK